MQSKLKTLTSSLIIAGAIGAVSLPVAAKKYRDYSNSTHDYAKVVDVAPIIETYQVNQPVERCWDEQVRVPARYSERQRYSRTPEILGGIIGAAIGNQFGSGRGKKVATAAGAVLGASVGRDVKHRNRYNDRYQRHARYETVQRCEVQDSYVTEERVVGFDVAYKYRGNVFHTQMDREPGKKIKVRVTVDPV
ncbi:MAG: glycine zipper 2TM domain-containing protein [Gammaproteobacteria bacterium]|nr:glycine zipper 2TM domain-containing protein [Gammaproteobacteria bacterium]